MELALIPPVALLDMTLQTTYQLALPHMFKDPWYEAHYKTLLAAQPIGAHVILDNGAAESEHIDNLDLVRLINELHPVEFALPDVLADTDKTVAQAFHFMLDFADQIPSDVRIGYVAQGTTVKESVEGVRHIIESAVGDAIRVVYIPRLLLKESGSREARLEVARQLYVEFPELDLHLFGASVEWPQEVRAAARMPWIRSMDTSLPFNYAINYELIDIETAGKINRPKDYFSLELDDRQTALSYVNVETFMEWARGD